MEAFIDYLAWIFGILSSMLLALRIFGAVTYDEMAEMRDAMMGIR